MKPSASFAKGSAAVHPRLFYIIKIFENEDSFLSEFLSWLTGEYVAPGTERDEFTSIKTGGFEKVFVSVRDRVCTVSIAGYYFSNENDETCFPSIMVFPNSIICRRDHPYVVLDVNKAIFNLYLLNIFFASS